MASKITSLLVESWGLLSLAGSWHVSVSSQWWDHSDPAAHDCASLSLGIFCTAAVAEYLCSGVGGDSELNSAVHWNNNWKISLSCSFSCICLQSCSWKCLSSMKPRLTEQNVCFHFSENFLLFLFALASPLEEKSQKLCYQKCQKSSWSLKAILQKGTQPSKSKEDLRRLEQNLWLP